jgi:hypothetical protein
MAKFHYLAAVAVAAMLAAGSVHSARADTTLAQPVPTQGAAHAALVENLAQPVQPVKPAGVARPALSNSLAQPVQAADTQPSCGCAPPAPSAPVVGFAPDGAPITGDLSRLRPSERLLGREQALRSHFGQQIHSGDRPWLPVADDN